MIATIFNQIPKPERGLKFVSNDNLVLRYRYGANYIDDYERFRSDVSTKRIIPYQVEIQPPPPGRKICWLECPYCYGISAQDTGVRMEKSRALEVMQQIADGGVKKIIFAGFATDPLNCNYIDDLLTQSINNKQVFGFNTKALKISEAFYEQLSRKDIVPSSYMSISVDAGSNTAYNNVHNVKGGAELYDRVLSLITRAGKIRKSSGNLFDISVSYLINVHNHDVDEVLSFIRDFKKAGCNMLRFAFAQPPKDIKTEAGVVPTKETISYYINKLRPVIEAENSAQCATMLVNADDDHDIFHKARTLPCFARFVYPTIGFDGWLYQCSQSSSPNFHQAAIGDLKTENFWDLLYNYDGDHLDSYFKSCSQKLTKSGCRCDRKEHILNEGVIASQAFDDVLKV